MNKIWKEKIYIHFLMEACGLGIFMISAGLFTILLFHPQFEFPYFIRHPLGRQILIGICMGSTAFFIITNSWLSRSGAHINPAITLCFYYLGRISALESLGYIIFQFLGGALGLEILNLGMGHYLSSPSVRYIVTIPGKEGPWLALWLELAIAFFLMMVVLGLGRSDKTRKFTPYMVALLVCLYAAFESPYSGFGMNPARTFASALISGIWTDYPIYLFCPILGMFLASFIFKNTDYHPHFGLGRPKHKLLTGS
jgi:aquaporin Z